MKGTGVLKRNYGIDFLSNGNAEVNLWSPLAEKVELKLVNGEKYLLNKSDCGYWQLKTNTIRPGDLYTFILDNEKELPDPASLSQPHGVHGASQAIDINFQWSDNTWTNPNLEEYIIYELHTGTFTPLGTFAAIEYHLDHLNDLGINAIEIMPVAQFPGERNWGYDGVYPYAVQHSYGGAYGLQQLVNLCHQKDIAVILDVVYNHLGPEGNYLGTCAPFFTSKYKTPWGDALNFDDAWCDGVRSFFIENTLMWFRDFHIDGLRLDAVHAIKDMSALHFLKEMKLNVNELMNATGKKHHLIIEMDLNDNRYINHINKCGFGMDAQWIDEFHHALRVSSGGERKGYYCDFNGLEHLAKAYNDAYVYDGQWSSHRKRKFGTKTDNEGKQFIVFSQNHDHVGNRMLGERTSLLVSFEMQKLMAAAVMVSPYIPMLFMGEEWRELNPFLYFVSHTDPQLAEAVRKGRKNEFSAFHSEEETPDPVSEETFLRSKLNWELKDQEKHNVMFRYYKYLVALRKNHQVLKRLDRLQLKTEIDIEKNILVLSRWNENTKLICWMNFSKKPQQITTNENPYSQTILDSSGPEWGGRQSAESNFINPESIKIIEMKK